MAKEIPLTQGKVAIVDDEDHAEVSRFKWCAVKGRKSNWYARRRVRNSEPNAGTWISLHRYLLSHVSPDFEIDHKNRDGLDNQRENLRVTTPSCNRINSGPSQANTSGYKGVSQGPFGRPYAQITHNRTRIYLGRFDTPLLAAQAYDAKAKELFGEFAYLNFSEVTA